MFRKLDVKQIQYESLSHEIQGALVANGLLFEASTLSIDTVKFNNDARKEIPDHTAMAYRYENYSKIVEFLDFGNKLKNSLTCAEAASRCILWAYAFNIPTASPYEPPRGA